MPKAGAQPAPVDSEAFLNSVRRLAEIEGRRLEDLLGEALAPLRRKRSRSARDRMRPELREWFDEHVRECGHVHEAFAAYDRARNEG